MLYLKYIIRSNLVTEIPIKGATVNGFGKFVLTVIVYFGNVVGDDIKVLLTT